ncbi:MAG: Glu-tRNA(Gln) amidotransferase subunit GatD [Candidatus Woesearchaeota archaeon]
MVKPQPRDRVKVICKEKGSKDKEYEGILMPNEETDNVIIKLDTGYNIGIDRLKVKSIKLIDVDSSKLKSMKISNHNVSKKSISKKYKSDKNKPTIAILHTGGTIASKVDYKSGAVSASFTVEDTLQMFPELKDIANIKTNLISNMMSEDMRFMHYQKIAHAIVDEIEGKGNSSKGDGNIDGIIIGHGTDTLAVTAAALAFMFEKLPIPVILVGSQRSTDRGSTDGAMNLICAAEFIAKIASEPNLNFAGVAICMHENSEDDNCLILPATKSRKMHTTRRDAFKSIDTSPIAKINYKTKNIVFLNKDHINKNQKLDLILKDKFEDKVGILRTYPNMNREIIDVFTKNNYKGLVLEATGLGQAPTNIKENLPNYEALKSFIKNGGVVVLTSQCIFGRVHPDVYTNCRRLKDIGIIFGEDMITETAHVKLAWLLGNYKTEDVKKLITQDLRGEISERTGTDFLD